MKKTALIFGATGLTGSILVSKLLQDDRYETIKVFGRKSINMYHKKLVEHICNLFDPTTFEKDFYGDEVYCCIGTTAAKTPDKVLYKKIDYGIPVTLAKLCQQNGVPTLLIISSLGANKNSPVFYSRTKGEMEIDVLNQEVKRTFFIQPALISGNRKEKRSGELLFKKLFSFLNVFLIGPLKKYRSIEPQVIASAMIKLANGDYAPGRIPSDKLAQIGSL